MNTSFVLLVMCPFKISNKDSLKVVRSLALTRGAKHCVRKVRRDQFEVQYTVPQWSDIERNAAVLQFLESAFISNWNT